jgi:hypothetical protein
MAKATAIVGNAGTSTDYQSLTVSGGAVSGSINVQPGWYDITIKVYNGGRLLSQNVLSKVGVGDVFITAGQSNFCNYYTPLVSTAPDDKVNSRGLTGLLPWRAGADPQDTVDGSSSSVFPALGNLITARTTYPVGFINVGHGGTTVQDWQPAGSYYPNIKTAIQTYFPGSNGFTAFLWHQGENDAGAGTTQVTYTAKLKVIIDQIRADAGWTMPCLIAVATHPNEATGAGVSAGQVDVGTNYTRCFQGANTDTLDNTYRTDNVHFNSSTGRTAHATLWYNALVSAGLI